MLTLYINNWLLLKKKRGKGKAIVCTTYCKTPMFRQASTILQIKVGKHLKSQ